MLQLPSGREASPGDGALPYKRHRMMQTLFSVHAGVAAKAHERQTGTPVHYISKTLGVRETLVTDRAGQYSY